MFEVPSRLSLAAQVANSMRKAIADGVWDTFLPGERQLCEIFQASRPTLRTALHLLAKEGLVDIRQGRRNKLRAKSASSHTQRSRLVVLVTGEPTSHLPFATYQGISEMRAHLAEHGFATEILSCQASSPKAQIRKVESFVRQNRVFCCVLRSVSKDLQQWFSERSIPALVLGSCHTAVKLASMDVDYRSVCRHAAGIFLSKGHRRMALIVPNSGMAGDLVSEQGFREAIEHGNHGAEASAMVVRHNGTPQNITVKLADLFNSAMPPTALLVAKPQHMFVVIMYLLKRGLTVPEDISLIARDDDHLFETAISHYPVDSSAYVHRLSRLMLQMVSNGCLPLEPNLIFPKYHSGGTVNEIA